MDIDKENISSNVDNGLMLFSPPKPRRGGLNKKLDRDIQALADPVMICAEFQESLWMTFGNVALNETKSLSFKLRNPNKVDSASLQVTKTPSSRIGKFSIKLGNNDKDNAIIPPGSEINGTLEWTPTDNMPLSEVILLKLNKKLPLQITLHGIAGTGERDTRRSNNNRNGKRSALTPAIQGRVNKAKTNHNDKNNSQKGLKKRSDSSIPSSGSNDTASKRSKTGTRGQSSAAKSSNGELVDLPTVVVHDSNWADKQIAGFSDWMNFTFIQAESQSEITTDNEIANDHNNNTSEKDDNASSNLRDVHERQRQNKIRKQGLLFFYSDTTRNLMSKLQSEVESGLIAFREDKDVHADIGLRALFLELLLSYEAQWLRLALEVVYGEILSLPTPTSSSTTSTATNSNNNKRNNKIKLSEEQRWRAALKAFVVDRVLSDPEIATEMDKSLLSLKARDELNITLQKHTLFKFLSIIYTLDHFRTAFLIKCPTLFVREAERKTSEDVLRCFNSEFLKGSGDIIRQLGLLGYEMSFKQTYIDEYHYRITNMKVDLRDGVKLTRLLEILSSNTSTNTANSSHTKDNKDLSSSLRVPANSRLQKIHNVNLVLNHLSELGTTLDGVEAKHIVDGNRDKTLLLLWKLMYTFETRTIIDSLVINKEIKTLDNAQIRGWRPHGVVVSDFEARSLAVSVAYRCSSSGDIIPATVKYGRHDSQFQEKDNQSSSSCDDSSTSLISWVDAVAGRYGVPVSNLTNALSDGRALCLLIHQYHPELVPLRSIQMTTRNIHEQLHSSVVTIQILKKALENERRNFTLLRKACHDLGGVPLMIPSYDTTNVPEEKSMIIFLGYLFTRLVDSSRAIHAVTSIQCFCRSKSASMRKIAVTTNILRLKQAAKKKISNNIKVDPNSLQELLRPMKSDSNGSNNTTTTKTTTTTNASNNGEDLFVVVKQSKKAAASIINKALMSYLLRRNIHSYAATLKEEARKKEIEMAELKAAEEQLRIEQEQLMIARQRKEEEDAAVRAEEAQRLLDFRKAADDELERCRIAERDARREEAEEQLMWQLENAKKEAEAAVLSAVAAEKEELEMQIRIISMQVEENEELYQNEASLRVELEQRLIDAETSAMTAREEMEEEVTIRVKERSQFDRSFVKKERTARVMAEKRTREETVSKNNAIKRERAARVAAENRVRKEIDARNLLERKVAAMEAAQRQLEKNTREHQQQLESQLSLKEEESQMLITKALEEAEIKRQEEILKELELKQKQDAEKEELQLKQDQYSTSCVQIQNLANVYVNDQKHKFLCQITQAIRKQLEEKEKAELMAATQAQAEAKIQKELLLQSQHASASVTIFKFFSHRVILMSRVHRLLKGFKRIQAVYRSWYCKVNCSQELKLLRLKIKQADINAKNDPLLQIGALTTSALTTIQNGKMISSLIEACKTLELSTSVSYRCASAFASTSTTTSSTISSTGNDDDNENDGPSTNASEILINMIKSCNRSKPHQELLKHALVILLHVARHDDLAPKVAETSTCVNVMVDLMQMFRDKSSIFGLSCELLCRLIKASNNVKNACNSSEISKRLGGLLAIIERKHRVQQKVKAVSKNNGNKSVSSTSPGSSDSTPTKGFNSYLSNQEPINCMHYLMDLLK